MRLLGLLLLLTCSVVTRLGAQPAETPELQLTPIRYELDATVNYEDETLAGVARITVLNRTDRPASEVSLLLYRLLSVDRLSDERRGELRFTQRVVSYDDFKKLQVNHIVAPLDPPMAAGDTTTIEVAYDGHLLGYAETGMEYIQDHISSDFTILRDDSRAFPQPGYPSFAANREAPMPNFEYVAWITVPSMLTVANGGELLEVIEREEQRTTYVYRSLVPSWRMDFAIARYATLETPPIRIFYFPADSVGAAAVANAATMAFERFESWFGPLADTTTLSFIEIPDGWGSQTDATAIIQAAAAFRDTTRHREVFHEISHLWNVRPTDLPSPRWNEGLASFLEYYMTETLTGEPAVAPRMDFLIEWLQRTLPSRPTWAEVPLVRYGEENMTGLSYRVGALFFDQLHRILGSDDFLRVVGDFYQTYHATGASTDDLISLIRDRAGPRADLLIEDWLTTTAWTTRIQQHPSVEALSQFYGG